MKILLWSDDLMSRVRIESRWKAAGAQLLKRDCTETPGLVVVDLTARDAAGHIRKLREQFPATDILAFGPHVDAEGFRAAKAAGGERMRRARLGGRARARAPRQRRMIRSGWALLCVLALATGPVQADDWKFGGHVKYQVTHTDYQADDIFAVFGDDPAHDHGLDLRLKAENRRGPWDFAAHYELLALDGDTLAARRSMASAGLPFSGTVNVLPDDRRRLFDLTHAITDRDRRAAVHRLDRLSLGHGSARQTLRFGRQAVSWGNGLVFQPLDFVNPFSPIAIDKDFKTGDDMLYGQWLVGEKDDLQAILLPRRDPATHHVESDQSTYAVKFRARLAGVDVDLLAARHYSEDLAGIGIVKSIGGAVWRLDASFTNLDNGGSATSLVTNMDYSWTWGGKNVYGYIEYFRNGVGETDRANYPAPSAELSARIARGELFTLARDYAAFGLQVELHPLFNVYGSLLTNLNDGSRFFQLRGVYDWRQNVQLMGGVNLPSGSRGTEYRGILVAGSSFYVAPGRAVYVRGGYYF